MSVIHIAALCYAAGAAISVAFGAQTHAQQTAELQSRIDSLAAAGGGTLTLTAGTYRTGALFFKPGVNLHLAKGAEIVGTDDAEGYPMRETRIEGETCLYYPALVNADAAKWNRGRYDAFVAAHPTAKGTGPAKSWEKGTLCPSDPATADFFAQTIREIAEAPVAGVVVCLWDDYGLNCVCARCKANGLANNWGRQVAVAVKAWERAVSSLGKELIVRTWASGASHWLGDEWVHAPGYGGESGEPLSVWGEAMKSAGPGVRFQTKVYNSDCQPAPPFSALLLGLPGTTADATPAGLRPLI